MTGEALRGPPRGASHFWRDSSSWRASFENGLLPSEPEPLTSCDRREGNYSLSAKDTAICRGSAHNSSRHYEFEFQPQAAKHYFRDPPEY
jgi:hypothetical protein